MPLLDTWAWVEYFQGSPAGGQIRPYAEGPDVYSSVMSVAELSDLYERDQMSGLAERLGFIRDRGPVLDVTERAARQAGATKWRQRKAGHPLGLADAIIYETARENGLDVITGDEGFEGLPGILFIEEELG